ncbi:MAG: hypothetical protein ACLGIK_17040, partial [Gemmatimonadota bacterium]
MLDPAERKAALLGMIGAARRRLVLSLFRCNDFSILDALAAADPDGPEGRAARAWIRLLHGDAAAVVGAGASCASSVGPAGSAGSGGAGRRPRHRLGRPASPFSGPEAPVCGSRRPVNHAATAPTPRDGRRRRAWARRPTTGAGAKASATGTPARAAAP